MKKYYPIDFDEKGNAVLGNAKNNPTSNGFIPTTWTPGGGSEEEGDGIKSVSISPAISTTPALESFFPIYWEDLTGEQKDNGVIINVETDGELSGEYAVTITPTAEWYAFADGTPTKGAAVTKPMRAHDGIATVSANVAASPDDESEDERYFRARITIAKSGK